MKVPWSKLNLALVVDALQRLIDRQETMNQPFYDSRVEDANFNKAAFGQVVETAAKFSEN